MITLTFEQYMELPYATTVETDECDGQICYIAKHPELRGCMAQGKTPTEAIANLSLAKADYIRALLNRGIEIPLPKNISKATV